MTMYFSGDSFVKDASVYIVCLYTAIKMTTSKKIRHKCMHLKFCLNSCLSTCYLPQHNKIISGSDMFVTPPEIIHFKFRIKPIISFSQQ